MQVLLVILAILWGFTPGLVAGPAMGVKCPEGVSIESVDPRIDYYMRRAPK